MKLGLKIRRFLSLPNLNRQGGFTLIETVMALAMTAFITTAGVLLVIQARAASQSVKGANEAAQNMLYAYSILREDLNTVRQPVDVVENDQGTSPAPNVANREVTLLSFARHGWENEAIEADRTQSVRVQYIYLFEDRIVKRRVFQAEAPNSQTPFIDRDLFRDVESVRLQFKSDGVRAPSWPPFDISLPEAVELHLTFESGEKLTLTALVSNVR